MLQQRDDRSARLVDVAPLMPELADFPGQSQAAINSPLSSDRAGPLEGSDVAIQPINSRSDLGGAQRRPEAFGQGSEVSRMGPTQRLDLACLLESLHGVLADRFEHHQPRLTRAIDRTDEGLLDQHMELVGLGHRRADRVHDHVGRVRIPRADEDG